jgi:hypothetical protein
VSVFIASWRKSQIVKPAANRVITMTPRPITRIRRLDGYLPPDLVNTLITALRSDLCGNSGQPGFARIAALRKLPTLG